MTHFDRLAKAAFGLAALAALAACGGSEEPTAEMRPASEAESACLRDVATAAGTTDIALISSEPTETGTMVKVRVGEDRTHWDCVAYADGTTGEIMAEPHMTEG
ncbi:hypothetical protein [Alloyangia pacifica]|uniref:hypothetical protein n=1 Tax=Alloyangia pacifica TaxID=311180 RepID=UPI001CFED0F4|nr:hypothetical protein [Alloyangia pacifica]